MKLPVYLDNHATTPLDPEVLEAMMPCFKENFGNPSSRSHSIGWMAEAVVKDSRERLASVIGASDEELIFTGSASEANNLAIKGLAELQPENKRHIVLSAVEHSSVLKTCRYLAAKGFQVTVLKVDSEGNIDLDELRASISDMTFLVSIQTANNEIGTIYPIRQIADICHEQDVLFHTDAVQAAGKIPFDVRELDVDMASISAHKNYGPKGIGALFIKHRRPKIRLEPQIFGGGQESALRSGTHNVAYIAGFAKAYEISQRVMDEEFLRLSRLRDQLYNELKKGLDNIHLNGPSFECRLPHNLNVSFSGVDINLLFSKTRDVAFSTGSACTSTSGNTSHVLEAIGLSDELKKCSLRFGLGRFNTGEEVLFAGKVINQAVRQL